MKILAIKLRALGDTVLLTAPLSELRRAYPEAEIHALVPEAWAPVLENHPAVNRVWRLTKSARPLARVAKLTALAVELRKERFDRVINFHASPSSAGVAFVTGARIRSIHFHGHKDKNLYSTVTVPGKGVLKPVIERDMDAVRALGIHVPAGRLPEIVLQNSEKQDAATLLSRTSLTGPLLALGLGASRPTKAWPIERFAWVAVDWALQGDGSALALAGPEEAAISRAFLKCVDDLLQETVPDQGARARVRARITALNNLGIRELAGVLSQAKVFVGNDSGPKHLAVAVGCPSVTLFGPEHPFEWHPYPPERHPYFFIEGLGCRRDGDEGKPPWCGLEVCTAEGHQCMRKIGAEQVLAECRRVGGVLK